MSGLQLFVAGPADVALVREFHERMATCYARYGASAAVTAPSAGALVRYLVVARDGEMVAGIRIHTRHRDGRLPLEAYLREHPVVQAEIARRAPEGLAELCGLWSAPDVARTGIGEHVVGAAVAVSPGFGLRHLCSFAHQFNRFTRKVGFEPDGRIGEHAWPDERHRSTVNWCDAALLPTAEAEVRERILALRALASRRPGAPLPLGFQPARPVEPLTART